MVRGVSAVQAYAFASINIPPTLSMDLVVDLSNLFYKTIHWL